jgi:hypothetical protein
LSLYKAFYCDLQLTVLPNGSLVNGRAFDISVGGVGIVCDVPLNRGQSVRVHFRLRNASQGWVQEDVVGRVAYLRADEDGNRIGIEFLEVIRESTNPMLAQMLDNL